MEVRSEAETDVPYKVTRVSAIASAMHRVCVVELPIEVLHEGSPVPPIVDVDILVTELRV